MTNKVAGAWTDPASAVSRRGLGPPGLLFYAATAVAALVALDANSRSSLTAFVATAVVWGVLATAWLVRFVARGTQRAMPIAHWVRWMVIPVVLAIVFVVTRTDAVKQARFDLSRGALDQMAADVMAGGRTERGWVGLYNVGTVERTGNGFWFAVDDSGLYRVGLAYSRSGEPVESAQNFSPLWQPATFNHVDGPWWSFSQGWD